MGWTFREYDETPAREVRELLELWRLQADEQDQKAPR